MERPTVSHLLQAAHLTCQQLVRGISSHIALLNSFSDVYIKPRTGSDFASSVNMSLAEMKNAMLKELESELETEQYDSIVSKDLSHTLTVKGLCKNSAYEIAKQIVYSTIKQANEEMSNSSAILSLFSVLTSYQKNSQDLLEIIYFIIKMDVKSNDNNKLKQLVSQMNETAYDSLRRENFLESYKRFFPEAYEIKSETICKVNSNFVFLYMELKNIIIQLSLSDNGFSAFNYSCAVSDGKLTDDFVEYPILKSCHHYLQMIDGYIGNAIKSGVTCLNDNMVCSLLQLLNWRERFIKTCSLPIFEKSKNKRTPILKEEIIPLLNVHSKWVQKYLLGELFKMPPNHKFLEKFIYDLDKLNLHGDQTHSKVAKLSKKLRKYYGQPKLYQNKEEYDICITKKELYNRMQFDLNEPIDKQLVKISTSPSQLSDTALAFDVPENSTIKDIEEIHIKINENKVNTDKVRSEQKVLPINLYVIQRVINILQPHLFSISIRLTDEFGNDKEMPNSDIIELLSSLVSLGSVMKGFPPSLLNQLQIIDNILGGNKDVIIKR